MHLELAHRLVIIPVTAGEVVHGELTHRLIALGRNGSELAHRLIAGELALDILQVSLLEPGLLRSQFYIIPSHMTHIEV